SIAGAQSQVVEAQVAWGNGAVGVGYTDNRLFEIGVGETDGAQHGAVGRALNAMGNLTAGAYVDLLSCGGHDARLPRDMGRDPRARTGHTRSTRARRRKC